MADSQFDRVKMAEERFAGPRGSAILRYWRGSSHYVSLNAGEGELYIGASSDREMARVIACRACGLEGTDDLVGEQAS